MNLILRWVVTAIAVAVAAHFVDGIRVTGGIEALLVISALLGLVNALVRPIVKALACGIIALTLGLFLLVINAGMLYVTSWLAGELGYGFEIDGFVPAVLAALVISVVSWIGSMLLTDDDD